MVTHLVPTPKANEALKYLVQHKCTKAEALRHAGYSPSVVKSPTSVFKSPSVQKLFKEAGLDATYVVRRLKNRLNYTRVHSMEFPLHEADERLGEGDPTSSLTDGQIMEIVESGQSTVLNIEYRNDRRVIWMRSPNHKIEQDTLDKLIAIHGLEAPKKIEGEMTHHFTLTNLRQAMEKNNYEVIPPKVHDV